MFDYCYFQRNFSHSETHRLNKDSKSTYHDFNLRQVLFEDFYYLSFESGSVQYSRRLRNDLSQKIPEKYDVRNRWISSHWRVLRHQWCFTSSSNFFSTLRNQSANSVHDDSCSSLTISQTHGGRQWIRVATFVIVRNRWQTESCQNEVIQESTRSDVLRQDVI